MNETTPLIGICAVAAPPHVATDQTWVDAVHHAGGQPLILPLLDGADTDVLLHVVDAIVLVGDADEACERSEIEIARGALAERVPVLGIGRGLNTLTVAAGGTLHPHQRVHDEATLCTVDVAANSTVGLSGFAGVREVRCGRHQGVATVGAGGRVTAVSVPEGGIEAVEWPDHPFAVGVRWQPEAAPMHDLFRALITASVAPLFHGAAYPAQPVQP